MAKLTEIRVHGVSGTPPAFMLRTNPLDAGKRPEPIDGETSEKTSPIELSVHNRDVPEHDVVAYNWSKLTSGRPRHALWLFLLPYTLLNAAGWMLPPRQRDAGDEKPPEGVLNTTQARWFDVAIRVAGGIVTGLFLVFLLAILIDLLGAKCQIGSDTCDVVRWLPEFSPGWWFLISTFLAIATMALIGVGIGLEPGRKAQSQAAMARLEAAGGVALPDPKGESDPAARLTITDPGFWQHRPLTTYLVLTHIGIAALIAGWVLASIRRHTTGISVSYWVAVVATVLVFGVLVLASSQRFSNLMPRLAWSALGIGVAAWLIAVVDAFGLSDLGWEGIDIEAGFSRVSVWLTLIVTAVGLVVWVIGGLSKSLSTSGTAAMIVLGGLVGTAFGAGFYTLVQRALDKGTDGTIEALEGMDWPAYLFLVYLLLLGGAAAWTMARDPLQLEEKLASEGLRTVTTKVRGILGWPAGITLAGAATFVIWVFARDGVRLESPFNALESQSRIVVVALSLVVLLAVVVVVYRFLEHIPAAAITAAIALVYVSVSAGWLSEINVLGAAVRFDSLRELTLSIALLVPVGFITSRLISMVRNREQRRGIAILWDLGSFWPRWYHPFGAPTYGPVAVPDLAALVREKAKDGDKVILAAHSQGSVISMSALLTIPADDPVWERIAYLTYGNPVCHLYSRLFGGHFTAEAISSVSQRLGGGTGSCEGEVDPSAPRPRWRNLWRQSDPIGGDIAIYGVESPALTERVEDGHSAYEITDTFKETRDELKQILTS